MNKALQEKLFRAANDSGRRATIARIQMVNQRQEERATSVKMIPQSGLHAIANCLTDDQMGEVYAVDVQGYDGVILIPKYMADQHVHQLNCRKLQDQHLSLKQLVKSRKLGEFQGDNTYEVLADDVFELVKEYLEGRAGDDTRMDVIQRILERFKDPEGQMILDAKTLSEQIKVSVQVQKCFKHMKWDGIIHKRENKAHWKQQRSGPAKEVEKRFF